MASNELDSRAWKNHSRVNDRIVRIRHYGNYLFYAAQQFEMVDKRLRDNTKYLIYHDSLQIPRPEHHLLLLKKTFLFTREDWNRYQEELKVKKVFPLVKSGFKFNFELVPLSTNAQLLFKCFDSFDKYQKKRYNKLKYIEYYDDLRPQNNKINGEGSILDL